MSELDPRWANRAWKEDWLLKPDPEPNHPTPGMHIWGWMTPTELEWLAEQATQMSTVVELGVLRGRSAFALLTACPGIVYCVDTWHDPGDHAYRGFMESCGHFQNLVAVRSDSADAASSDVIPEKVDMVFIDADHSYEALTRDIQAWLPKTTRLICGHDYSDPADYTEQSAGYEGVWRAVQEMFGETHKIELGPGTSIWAVWL